MGKWDSGKIRLWEKEISEESISGKWVSGLWDLGKCYFGRMGQLGMYQVQGLRCKGGPKVPKPAGRPRTMSAPKF